MVTIDGARARDKHGLVGTWKRKRADFIALDAQVPAVFRFTGDR
jgi:hypothetical protein